MVYCAEGVDNREFDVRTLVLNYDSEIKEQMKEIESLGRLVALSGKGLAGPIRLGWRTFIFLLMDTFLEGSLLNTS